MKEVISIFQMIALLLEMVTGLGYQQSNVVIHNYPQEIYWLEVDTEKGIEVSGALAKDSVFGFEQIGKLAAAHSAIASVNGMFFDDLGSPAGLLCENKRWIRITGIGTPSLVITDRPSLQEITVNARWQSGTRTGQIGALNIGAYHGLVNAFTKEYGETNRVFRPQVSYRLEKDKVVARYLSDEPTAIGAEYVITCLLPEDTDMERIGWDALPSYIPVFEVGQEVKICFEAENAEGERIFPQSVYQTGGWIVKNGAIATKAYEQFVGYTTSLQPRTAVGMNRSGNLVFCVVDGRRKNEAEGLSGQWLAEVLQEFEVVDAAYLDGGASSMLWMGELINVPAYADRNSGKEIAHSILLKRVQFGEIKKSFD